MASLKGRHFSFSDRLYFRKIFQLAGKGHTNVSAVWRKGDPTMQTEISLKGQYKNTAFSFISWFRLRGEGCGNGTAWGVCGGSLWLGISPLFPFCTSLFSGTTNCIHPICVSVHLGGKQTDSRTDPHPAWPRGKNPASTEPAFPSFSHVFLSLPEDSGGELRWGLFWMVGLGILNRAVLKTNSADCRLSPWPLSEPC